MSKKAGALGKTVSPGARRYKVRTRQDALSMRGKSLAKKKASVKYKAAWKTAAGHVVDSDAQSIFGAKISIRPRSLASIGRMQVKYGSVLRRLAKR